MTCPVCAAEIKDTQSRILAVIHGGVYRYCHRSCADKRIIELEAEKDIYKNALHNLGFCTVCMSVPEHHIDEPFASCKCGTGEDYGKALLQAAQLEIHRLRNVLCRPKR